MSIRQRQEATTAAPTEQTIKNNDKNKSTYFRTHSKIIIKKKKKSTHVKKYFWSNNPNELSEMDLKTFTDPVPQIRLTQILNRLCVCLFQCSVLVQLPGTKAEAEQKNRNAHKHGRAWTLTWMSLFINRRWKSVDSYPEESWTAEWFPVVMSWVWYALIKGSKSSITPRSPVTEGFE